MSERNGLARPPTGVGLDGLASAAAGCRACELWEPATQTVFGEGPPTARIVLVGEQPGDQEDRTGEPFVSPVLRPEVVVTLAATAAKALIAPSFRIMEDRGRLQPWALPGLPPPPVTDEADEGAPAQTWVLATTHTSAILRTPDEARAAAYDALVADLRVVARALA